VRGYVLGRKVLKETLWAYIGKASAIVLGLAYTALLARMGPERYGLFGLAMIVALFISFVANFGLGASTSRFLAKHRTFAPHLIPRILADGAFLAALFAGMVLTVSFVFFDPLMSAIGRPELSEYRFPILLAALALRVGESPKAYFEGLHRQRFATTVVFTEHSFKLVFVAVLSMTLLTVFTALIGMSVALIGAGVVGFTILFVRFFDREKYASTTIRFRKKIMFFALPIAGVHATVILMATIDGVMLGMLSTSLQLGYYVMARQLAMYLSVLVAPLRAGVAPKFGELRRENALELMTLHRRTMCAVAGGLLAVCLGVFVFSEWIVVTVFGADYRAGVVVLRVLLIASVCHAVGFLNRSILLYMGCNFMACGIGSLCVVLNVVLNALLIPGYGALGAAVATAASYLPGAVLGALAVRSKLRKALRSAG